MDYLIGYLSLLGINTLTLWTSCQLNIISILKRNILLIALICSGVFFIPSIGWLLFPLIMAILLKLLSEADFYPDIILIITVTLFFNFLFIMFIFALIEKFS